MQRQSLDSFIKETSQQAMNQLENYFEAPEHINEYLDFQSQFYKYSLRNQLLIANQYKGAMAVAPYKKWQEFDCNVKKGEKAIKVLVPQERKTFIREEDNKKVNVPIKQATKDELDKIKNNEIKVNKQVTFVKGNVFDIQQTNLPKEKYPKIMQELRGEVPNYQEKMDNLKAIAHSMDINTQNSENSMQGAKGFYAENQQGDKIIQLNKYNDEKQNVSTMIHELAHGIMHNSDEIQKNGNLPKNHKEFQAEMTALIVGNYMGLENDDKALRYIHNYSQDISNENKMDLMKNVQKTSSSIIKGINGQDSQQIYFEANKNKDRVYIKPEEVKNNSMLRTDQLYTLQDANYFVKEMNTTLKANLVFHQDNQINIAETMEYSYSPNQTNLEQFNLYEHVKTYTDLSNSNAEDQIDREANNDKPTNNKSNLTFLKEDQSIER
ncbi:ImmA/IrrE family metallo-endopeptidase [Staphylococcus aureus]|nr:ImmA/IrrE family metallo-endopeptidase [Staphylococcus aureus]